MVESNHREYEIFAILYPLYLSPLPSLLFLYSPLMWEYLKTVVSFLKSFKRDLQEELGEAEGADEEEKCLSVQQSLMNSLRPFGIPGSTDPNTIDNVIQKNDMKDLGGM